MCGDKFCVCASEEMDLVIGGFTCTPYSQLNLKRWTSQVADMINSVDGQVFLDISTWLSTTNVPLKHVILENAASISRTSKKTQEVPLDAILTGSGVVNGSFCKFGLRHNSRYVTTVHFASASDQGFPHERNRVWIKMCRKDVAVNEGAFVIYLQRCILDGPRQTFLDYLDDDDDDDDDDQFCSEPASKRRCASKVMVQATMEKHAKCRISLKLPKHGSEGSRPFSMSAPKAILEKLTAREIDVVDIAVLVCSEKKVDMDKLIVDVSQDVSRSPWKADGSLKTPHCGAKYVVAKRGRLLTLKEMFAVMGADMVKFPSGISHAQATRLVGNMMCVPTVGAVLASHFASLPYAGPSS